MIKKTKSIVKTAVSLLLVAMLLCTGIINVMATTETENETAATSIVDSLKDNLLLYSSFDNENVNDESGNETVHNGKVIGSVSYVNGIKGKAVYIAGQNNYGNTAASNYINYGASNAIIPGEGDFTVSMFFRATTNTFATDGRNKGLHLLGTKDYGSGKNVGFSIMAEAENVRSGEFSVDVNAAFEEKTGRVDCRVLDSAPLQISDGNWHMVTVSFDRDGYLLVYIDNVLVSHNSIASSDGLSINDTLSLNLGADGSGKYGTRDSEIDELRIYDKALTAAEIESVYEYTTNTDKGNFDPAKGLLLYSNFDEENANDESGNNHHGEIHDKEGYEVEYIDGITGKALHIENQENAMLDSDATADPPVQASTYVNYGWGILPDTDDFTFSIFFKASAKIGENTVLLSNKDYTHGYNAGFALIMDDSPNGTSQRMNFGAGTDGTNTNIANPAAPGTGADDGEWHMITTTFDRDGYMVLYIDGVQIVTGDCLDNTDVSSYSGISAHKNISINAANLPLILGADGDLGYGTHNSIVDELRIYDKALTAREVSELYTYTTTPAASVEQGDSTINYMSLEDALAAAESGAVVKLLADCTVTDVTVPVGVTLDLNGNTLTVDTLYAVDGAAVVDTTNAEGRLVVNESATILDADNNNYVAMKLTENDGANTYALVPMLLQAKADTTDIENGAMSVKIRPAVNLDSATETTNTLFGDGAEDNGLSFSVRVTWTAEDESEGKQTLTFADTLVAEAYTAGKAMTLNMTGIPANTALTVDLVVTSTLGAEVVANIYTK